MKRGDSLNNRIKYNLAELRAANDITQMEMAEHLNIAVSTYNMYENGIRTIPSDKAQQIAFILGVEINDIFLPIKFTISKSE